MALCVSVCAPLLVCLRATLLVCLGVALRLLLLWLVEDKGEAALAAVLAVKVGSHEDTRPAVLVWTLTAKARDLTVLIHLVVLEHRKLHLLLLVLVLLRRRVVLLLSLLRPSGQRRHEVQCRLGNHIAVDQKELVVKATAGKHQMLVVNGNAAGLKVILDITDRAAWPDLNDVGHLTLHKDLHPETLFVLSM